MTKKEVKQLKKLAKKGDKEALLKLGYEYIANEEFTKKYAKGLQILEQLGNEGNGEALYMLGNYYCGLWLNRGFNDGTPLGGCRVDTEEAVKYLEASLKAKYYRSIFPLHWYYINKNSDVYNPKRAFELAKICLPIYPQLGHSMLGWHYLAGVGVEESLTKAKKNFQEGIKQNDIRCYYYLARLLIHGYKGTKRNVKKGIEYLTYAAQHDSAESCLLLAELYWNGLEVKQNYELAWKYVHSPCCDKNRLQEEFIAMFYWFGVYVQQDKDKAIESLKMLVNFDECDWSRYIYGCYLYINDIDRERGITLLRWSAQAGNKNAIEYLNKNNIPLE